MTDMLRHACHAIATAIAPGPGAAEAETPLDPSGGDRAPEGLVVDELERVGSPTVLSSLAVGRLVCGDERQLLVLKHCLSAAMEYVGDRVSWPASPTVLRNAFFVLDACLKCSKAGTDLEIASAVLRDGFMHAPETENVLRSCFSRQAYAGATEEVVRAVWDRWSAPGRKGFAVTFCPAPAQAERQEVSDVDGGEVLARDIEQYEGCSQQLRDLCSWLAAGGRDSRKGASQVCVLHKVLFKAFVLDSVVQTTVGREIPQSVWDKHARCQRAFHEVLREVETLRFSDTPSMAKKKQMSFRAVLGEIKNFIAAEDVALGGVKYWKDKYMAERETRRETHEQLQQMRGNIRVLCRIRPLADAASEEAAATMPMPGLIRLRSCQKNRRTLDFEYNCCFAGDATQEEIFREISPLIMSFADGYNACIFAYGQTGSGKTFTMQGPKANPGVAPRALRLLFDQAKRSEEAGTEKRIEVSFLEVYNETVRDLLSPSPSKLLDICTLGPHQLGPNADRVPGLTKKHGASVGDVESLIALGSRNRATTAHSMNEHSSRSHAVLSVRYFDVEGGETHAPVLHLVDLAGSERIAKSEVKGIHLKEAQAINKSLSALGDVIASLQQRQKHVPYRNSKLTQLLQDSLAGNSKVMMVCNISPEESSVSETASSLNFAKRANQVEAGQAKKVTVGGRA